MNTTQDRVPDNKIRITVTDGKIQYNTREDSNVMDLMTVLFAVMQGAMRQVVRSAPAEYQADIKGTLYDMLNVAASNTLKGFAPELELRPTLTAQAILEAENRIVMEGRLSEVERGS